MDWTTEEIILAIDNTKCAKEVSTSIRQLRTYLNVTESTSNTEQPCLNLTLLANLKRLFIITLPAAPNIHLAGGVLLSRPDSPAVSVSGTHFSIKLALIALAGEIAESLARDPMRQLLPDTKVLSYAENKSALQQYGQQLLSRLPHIEHDGLLLAKPVSDLEQAEPRVPDYKACGYPAVLCRAYSKQPNTLPPISEGYAAHQSLDRAIKNGICEKFERDAAAAWWIGGVPPRQIKPALLEYFDNLQIQGGQTGKIYRTYKLLELTLDFGPPVFAAISCDTHGYGLAVGLSCKFNEEAAVKRAFLELKQMEFAQFIAWKKQTELGSEQLNRTEISALSRATKLNVKKFNLFRSRRPTRNHDLPKAQYSTTEFSISAKANNINLYYVDLSSTDKGPFVVKVLSPELVSPVLGFPQPRLTQYNRQWGVSEAARLGVDLL